MNTWFYVYSQAIPEKQRFVAWQYEAKEKIGVSEWVRLVPKLGSRVGETCWTASFLNKIIRKSTSAVSDAKNNAAIFTFYGI